jgi:pimeloyl-ACP methyl ester carboxylesterase
VKTIIATGFKTRLSYQCGGIYTYWDYVRDLSAEARIVQHMKKIICLSVFLMTAFPLVAKVAAQATGKPPVIIIPGISGSQLVNPKTDKTVWFSLRRDKDDDVRLPMTSPVLSRNRDGLRATDIIREVKVPVLPDIEVYQSLIDALKARGYTEATWNDPKAADVFYVFPYDWRRDNVESAQLLISRMEGVKSALRRPTLKFDVIAHSMGGLVARYAAMYGSADLPAAHVKSSGTWAGARHFNKIMMFGTPNEGSFSAFDVLLNGYPIVASRRLPLIDDFRPEDVLSSPSIFQLLPRDAGARIFNDALEPMKIDIYDIDNWEKYGWGAFGDIKFLSKLRDAQKLALKNKDIKPVAPGKDAAADDRLLSRTTYAQVRAFVAAALKRAKQFHDALDVPMQKAPVQFYIYGGNCAPTLDGVVMVQDEKKNKWEMLFTARDIKGANGAEVKKDAVRQKLFADGDGRVTVQSLLTTSEIKAGGLSPDAKTLFPVTSSFFGCGSHTRLFLEKPIQDSFLSALVVEKQAQP